MNRFLSLLLPAMACLVGFTAIHVSPDSRIRMSAWSDRILLVEITKVTFSDEQVNDGIGYRKIEVEGKVIQLIRGEQKTKMFHASKDLMRVVDAKEAKAKHDENTLMVMNAASHDNTGITECKVGKRYVVNFTGTDSQFTNEFFFTEVTKDNDDWRKKILPRRHPEAEAKSK
jgi:hypothetical protein